MWRGGQRTASVDVSITDTKIYCELKHTKNRPSNVIGIIKILLLFLQSLQDSSNVPCVEKTYVVTVALKIKWRYDPIAAYHYSETMYKKNIHRGCHSEMSNKLLGSPKDR